MKRILFILGLFTSLVGAGQSTYYIRADSTRLEKVGGSNNLILLNTTRSMTGAYLKNVLNGRTAFSYAGDSMSISGSNLTMWRGAGTQNVTVAIPSSGGTVTSVTGNLPITVATGTTTPVIGIGGLTTYGTATQVMRMNAGATGLEWGTVDLSTKWDLSGNDINPAINFIGTTTNESMRFRTNNTEYMVLDSNGRLGIGIASPLYKLHVVGSDAYPVKITGSSGGGLILGNYNATYGGIWSANVTPSTSNYALISTGASTLINGTTGIGLTVNDATSILTITASSAALTKPLLFTNDNTDDIGASGATRPRNIYTGTLVTSPAFTKSAATTGAITDSIVVRNGGTGIYKEINANYFAAASSISGTANQVAYFTGTNVIGGSANMTFDGTNLTVGGDVIAGDYMAFTSYLRNVSNDFHIYGAGAGKITFYNGAETDAPLIQLGGTSSSFSAIKRNGAGVQIIGADDVVGSNFLMVPTVIGGTTTTSPLTLQSTSGSGTTGSDIIFKDDNTEWMRILNNGNVGIGLAAPGTLLEVSASNPTVRITSPTNGTITLNMAASDGTIRAGIIADIAGGEIKMGGLGGSGYFPTFYVSGAEKMRLSTAGNLLVGTTTNEASSLVTMASTTKGLLIPRMTGAQRTAIGSPAQGLLAYQTGVGTTSAEGMYGYIASNWRRFLTDADSSVLAGLYTSSNGITKTGNNFKWGGALVDATTNINVDDKILVIDQADILELSTNTSRGLMLDDSITLGALSTPNDYSRLIVKTDTVTLRPHQGWFRIDTLQTGTTSDKVVLHTSEGMVKEIAMSSILSNGSGTTANGTAVDLGGTLSTTVDIDIQGHYFALGTGAGDLFRVDGTAATAQLGDTDAFVLTNNATDDIALTSTTVTVSSLAGTGSRAVLADAAGVLTAPVSDRSVKEFITPLGNGIETVMKLKPVSFEYKNGWKNYGNGSNY